MTSFNLRTSDFVGQGPDYVGTTSDVQILTGILCMVFLFVPVMAGAEVFESSNFKVLDPVISVGAEYSTSTSFILHQTLGESSLGTSSATNFQIIAGFLPFPSLKLPTLSAASGDGQVSLSWTAASGFLGWTVSGYNVGRSGSTGGPYTYTSVGNVTSATVTGLSNATAYYFIIRPEDFFGNSIGTSTEVSQTPVASPAASSRTGGGPPSLISVPTHPLVLSPFVRVIPEFIAPDGKLTAYCKFSDFNKNGRVNLTDLSIFLYYHGGSPEERALVDINKDNQVDIVDLSVLFYCLGI